mmetsp:Transcript_38497/g.85933  ORF Transcript_38497/g.85933 Transcript_38497/m.85933 type:complete len:380 (+) Transcript_38497:508-1647(+)
MARVPGEPLLFPDGPEQRLVGLVQVGLVALERRRSRVLRLELLLLHFERLELGLDVRVDEVAHVLAVHHLGHDIVPPLVVLQQVALPQVRAVHARPAPLEHHVLLRAPPGLPEEARRPGRQHRLGDERLLGRLLDPRHGEAVEHVTHLGAREARVHARLQQEVARPILHRRHARLRHVAHLHELHAAVLPDEPLDLGAVLRAQVVEGDHIDLVEHHHQLLVREEGLDGLEEGHLLGDREAALLRDVDEVEHRALEVGESGDGLHLDGVALVQGVVEDAGRVDHLPPQVPVVHVPHVQRLGREGVRLHLHVRAGHLVHEGGLAHVGVAADDEGPRVGVDRGEAAQVLAHLLEVRQARLLTLDDRHHTPQRRALELLAAVE